MKNKCYPILPLRDVVIYPQVVIPLFIGRKPSINALNYAIENDQKLILVPQKDSKYEDPETEQLHNIGCLGKIIQMATLSDGTVKALVEGIERVYITRFHQKNDRVDCEFNILANEKESEELEQQQQLQAMANAAVDYFARYLSENDKYSEEIIQTIKNLNDGGRIADTIAAHMELRLQQRVDILEQINIEQRLERVLIILEEEHNKTEIERTLKKRVKQQMERNQREYHLNEQLKAIQKELGEMEDAYSEVEQFEQAISAAKMPEEARKKATAELNKLKQMSPMSSEANVIRNYLEWMVDYPWAKKRRIQYDLQRAEKILERDHYGLADIKERVLEYLAVQKRNRSGRGPIICLVGPPGVGKTSLGQSIAAATGRDFERISLGGMHDEAEIRGHRRTYIGALPGKIVQKICKLGSCNPVILLDEIDKIGSDHRGDPASALLEVLDPAQNNTFNDHYLECAIDLSKILFIATANTLDIAAALRDRMEIIRLAGYTENEKKAIAQRYLLPRQLKENALKNKEITFEDGVIEYIIEHYTREAGVRNLEREIGKVARKSVRKLIDNNSKIIINNDNITTFLGVEKYTRNQEDLSPKIGSVTGLAWTAVGGELLQIETAIFQGKGKLNITGQLGEVMKESIQAAHSVVRSYLENIDDSFKMNECDIHIHLPEGATPKDGPSAGIAIAVALLSALTNIPAKGDVAMTGEITLRGRVLPIGGLKEKLLAAQRGHIDSVLIPIENAKDLADVPSEISDNLKVHLVSSIGEVFVHMFETNEFSLPEMILHAKRDGKFKYLQKTTA